MKTETVRARVAPDLKIEVHHVLKEIGITPTQLITMVYQFIRRKHALPTDLSSLPNVETAQAIEDAKAEYWNKFRFYVLFAILVEIYCVTVNQQLILQN